MEAISIFSWKFRQMRFCIHVRSAPTKEVLLKWWQGKSNTHTKEIKNFLIRHAELEKEYREAQYLYDKKHEWKLAYLNHRKLHYETKVSGGLTSPEYAGVLERIKIHNTADKDLPLMVGQLKTDEGTKEFTERFNKENDNENQ